MIYHLSILSTLVSHFYIWGRWLRETTIHLTLVSRTLHWDFENQNEVEELAEKKE